MSLWGAAPVLVVALLAGAGHAGAGHPGRVHDGGQASAAHPARVELASVLAYRAPDAAGQPPTGPSLATTSAVIAPVGADKWQTTVLLNNTGTTCPPGSKLRANSSYLLETSRPDHVFTATNVVPVMTGNGTKSQPNTCVAVTLTFAGLSQAPESAALEFEAGQASPSSVQLTVSRPVSLLVYLVVPLVAGVAMVALLMFLILYVVRIYDWDGSRLLPFRYGPQERERLRPNRDFWHRTVSASGAWTVNDSWATNIATGVAVLTAVLTTTTAANSLFPGVALDRFALVTVVAGGIVTAVPLAFGILYARWIERYRGITADCLITPAMKLPPGCEVTVQEDTDVTWHPMGRGLRHLLVQDQSIKLTANNSEGQLKMPRADSRWCIAAVSGQVSLSAGSAVTLLAGTAFRPPGSPPSGGQQATPSRTTLIKAVTVKLPRETSGAPAFSQWVRIPPGETVTIEDEANAPHGLAVGTAITLPEGAIAIYAEQSPGTPEQDSRESAARKAVLLDGTVTLLGGQETRATLCSPVENAPAGAEVTLPSGVEVKVSQPIPDAPAAPRQPAVEAVDATVAVKVPAGAVITAPGGAVLGTADDPGGWSTLLKAGGKIQVPLKSTINIHAYGGTVLALPGGSDVAVAGESYFKIISRAGAIAIVGDDLVSPAKAATGEETPGAAPQGTGPARGQSTPDKPDKPDQVLESPVYGIWSAGAKITVAGTAEVILPAQMALTAPRRDDFVLTEIRHVIVPQAGVSLVADMWLVVVAALITMFGVGAQVGVAGTLALLSDAATAGQWIMLAIIALAACFTVYYGATAIRALADPQPGSSLSGTSGSSFTL